MFRFYLLAAYLAVVLLALLPAGCGGPDKRAAEKAAAPAKPAPMPDIYRAGLETTRGDIVIEVHKEWAPRGAERFYDLVNANFYDGARFYRVVRNYIAQFGFSGRPQVDALWSMAYMPDDPPNKLSNKRGYVSFAQSGPRTRSTQIFINLRDNRDLDRSGFVPFGQVVEGMEVVDKLYFSYGDIPPRGNGPDPTRLGKEGNEYLENQFPRLDTIKKITITPVP
jgi:peptidyl-prolyl cis-trans isomerase A (cyclophilin A)